MELAINTHFKHYRSKPQRASFVRAGVTLLLAAAMLLSAACEILRSDLKDLSGSSEGTLVANMYVELHPRHDESYKVWEFQ